MLTSPPIKGHWLRQASQNKIHERTSIRKASLTQTMRTPSTILCSIIRKNVPAHMGLTQTHVYAHNSLYIALGDSNNLHCSRGINTRWHVCRTDCDTFASKSIYTHSQKLSLKGCHRHASTILLCWRRLSCPKNSLTARGLAFSLEDNNPIRGLCVSLVLLFDGDYNKRHSLCCDCWDTVIVPRWILIVFCLGTLDRHLTDIKQLNGANRCLFIGFLWLFTEEFHVLFAPRL